MNGLPKSWVVSGYGLTDDPALKLRWTLRAIDRLEAIGTVIAQDDPAAAERVVQRIAARVVDLTRMPFLGRTGRCRDTRELVVPDTPYIVGYRVAGGEVIILSILHGAQRWPRRL